MYTGIALILILTPIGRGTVRIWSTLPLIPIGFLVFLWLWNNNQKLQKTVLGKPIMAFVLLAIVSFIFSVYKRDSFYALLRLLGYVGVYYLIANNYDRRMRRRLIGLIICIGAGISLYGLLQYFGVFPHAWWCPRDFLAATYVNHNHFSGYLELVIPVAIGALIHYNRSMSAVVKLILIEALAVIIAAFIFAQSRGAWISLAISLILMNIILVKKRLLAGKSIPILILLIILIFSFAYVKSEFVSERMDILARITEGEASIETRFRVWQGTVGMIRDNPLTGTGLGSFVWVFPRYRPQGLNTRTYYAHNDYLHMAAEMGVLAPLIMTWLLVTVIGRGLLKMGSHPVVLGCSIGMLSLALHGLVDFNFHIPANMLLFTVYAAFVIGETGLKEKSC